MNSDLLNLGLRTIRGTDSNSLLRLYDLASEFLQGSPLRLDRTRVDRARRRIAAELEKRGIRP
jgi:hypothetical protein